MILVFADALDHVVASQFYRPKINYLSDRASIGTSVFDYESERLYIKKKSDILSPDIAISEVR